MSAACLPGKRCKGQTKCGFSGSYDGFTAMRKSNPFGLTLWLPTISREYFGNGASEESFAYKPIKMSVLAGILLCQFCPSRKSLHIQQANLRAKKGKTN